MKTPRPSYSPRALSLRTTPSQGTPHPVKAPYQVKASGPPPQQAAAPGENKINESGLNIIRWSEGLRLEAYRSGGGWRIGYGHGATAKEGMKITEAQANALLRADVEIAENAVRPPCDG